MPEEEQEALEPIPDPIYEACPACGSLMDVTGELPFSEVYCPSCGQHLRVRKQFNNFTLLEVLGEGGMGSVFKAIDLNLQRHVALKILKPEVSANVEERARLEQEARITASINHPHVVKVFSFGQDHGQFYLAMELVEKGSLDNLMGIQGRVAEIQVLEVGIQIAQGLDAALERGLIHRDIKPGNILFADAHTAKLVDFGLALAMAEEAEAHGEIWGTPYYIAPEKLDHLPEDFRSDIYSLGGTLFHALAGRPPYEAATASMVALKQLKSQPVSLQSFAPDISSETAYVINRMLAKEPDDRYPSYAELIEHLSYAREKLVERSKKPHQTKQRAVVESQQTKTVIALVSFTLLLVALVGGILLFIYRDKVFGVTKEANQTRAALVVADLPGIVSQQSGAIADSHFAQLAKAFGDLAERPGTAQPMLDWLKFNRGLALVLDGDEAGAREIFLPISKQELYSSEPGEVALAGFFVEASRLMSGPKPISGGTAKLYGAQDFEAFGLLLFGAKDFALGAFADAQPLLAKFCEAKFSPPYAWMEAYRPSAERISSTLKTYLALEGASKLAKGPSASKLLEQVRELKMLAGDSPKLSEALDQLETKLGDAAKQ